MFLQAGQLYWAVGTVWGPGRDGCSADASCPISYSQHNTEHSYGTRPNKNTCMYAIRHIQKSSCQSENQECGWLSKIILGRRRQKKVSKCWTENSIQQLVSPTWITSYVFGAQDSSNCVSSMCTCQETILNWHLLHCFTFLTDIWKTCWHRSERNNVHITGGNVRSTMFLWNEKYARRWKIGALSHK